MTTPGEATSSHELCGILERIVHDLAQPLCALQCLLETAPQKPPDANTYLIMLQDLRELVRGLNLQVESLRGFADSESPSRKSPQRGSKTSDGVLPRNGSHGIRRDGRQSHDEFFRPK